MPIFSPEIQVDGMELGCFMGQDGPSMHFQLVASPG